jgi:hypothetical protein
MLHTLALLLAASSSVTIQPIDSDRFQLTIVFKDRSFSGHAEAQLALAAAAQRQCRGKGRPVSAGTLTLNEIPASATGRRRLSLSEEWRCVPAAR